MNMKIYIMLSIAIITIFFVGVLYLWHTSIENQKYEDIVSCWKDEVKTSSTVDPTGQLINLCNILSTP